MMQLQGISRFRALISACLFALLTDVALGDYAVQRVASGLNQPTYVTQAPGDPGSLYIVERNDGNNVVGRIRKYDMLTGTLSTFLDMPGTVVQDGGLISMTFHPNYSSNGLFYVLGTNGNTNALDEYKTIAGVPQLQRRILQYSALNNVFHTIDQAHFRPGGNNNELFVLTGDGGTQASEAAFSPALIEDPNSIYGKVLKIDLTGNFSTPASAASHPAIDVVALGIRNPYRSSFDRTTGDFYFGDVGFNVAEEVNFIPASQFTAATPLDFGWTSREGTVQTSPSPPGGPGTPAVDLNPIFDYPHPGRSVAHTAPFNGLAVIGGYVYRGPVTELSGRYFFAEHILGQVYSGQFNTATLPSTYNGQNITGVVNHTVDYENRIGGGADIQFITSYGEDLAGNLYIVKIGTASYPPIGQGEIFRIMPISPLQVEVNRDSGRISVKNTGTSAISLSAIALSTPFGALNPSALLPITGHYDVNGDGTVDNNNAWLVLSAANSQTELRERSLGDPGALDPGEQVFLSLDDGWIPSPTEDLVFRVQLDDGSIINPSVNFTQHGGQKFKRSDFDFDDDLDAADWLTFRANHGKSLSAYTLAEAYALGDLNGDGANNFNDFRLFQTDYINANGQAAFNALGVDVPEPTALALALLGAAVTFAKLRRRASR